MSNPDVVIRLYQPADREDMLRIGADTAFFGEPIEKYMEDRQIFSDAFYSYYTDVEPGYSWIAEVDGKVAGFLAGCPDSRAKAGLYIRNVLPALLRSLTHGKYRFGPLTRDYLRRLVGAGFRRETPRADFSIYPAHLHINLDAGFRGHGIGRKLMTAYLGPAAPLERCRRALDDHQHEPGSLSFIREHGVPSARCPPDPHVGGNYGGIFGEPLLWIDTPQQ